MPEMSPLRSRVIEDMTVRNLSPATQRSYIDAVAKFSRHGGKAEPPNYLLWSDHFRGSILNRPFFNCVTSNQSYSAAHIAGIDADEDRIRATSLGVSCSS
jgi:hypothetical protein